MSLVCVLMQEQQRALKAAQQYDKVPKARSTAVAPAVISEEKQPTKDVDDVRWRICSLSHIYAILYFLGHESEHYT
jgi:hypothetical protein